MQGSRHGIILLFWHVALLSRCAAEYSANDCLVGDLKTQDCRFGTFAIDFEEDLRVDQMVGAFSLTLSHNWSDVTVPAVFAQQQVRATINNGTLRYFYTKLTDRPAEKKVADIEVAVKIGKKTHLLKPCAVAADLSDVDSRKWQDCHMVLISQHYAAIKVYVSEEEVGAKRDCPSCLTDTVGIHLWYTVSHAVCSGKLTPSVDGNWTDEDETVEGLSYMYYMRDWDVYPRPFVLEFVWPSGSAPWACQLGGEQRRVDYSAAGVGSAQVVLRTSDEVQSLLYLSWQPTEYFASCLYGPIPAAKIADVFLSLFIVSVVICCVMVALLGWSKYASWQWYGGDFEWDVQSEEEDNEDVDVGKKQEYQNSKHQHGFKAWSDRRRLSLKALSLTNWMYSKHGEEQMNYSVSGNMEISMSTSRRRKSSIDMSVYAPPESSSVMNPLFSTTEEQRQEWADSFQPTVAPRRAPEPGFDWNQFGHRPEASKGRTEAGDIVNPMFSPTTV